MSTNISLVVFGKSSMLYDIEDILAESYDIINVNTDEEVYTCEFSKPRSYISCFGSPKSYLTKVETLKNLSIDGEWININLCQYQDFHFKGVGNLIFPSVYLSRSAYFDNHCLVMPHATIHHGCNLGDGCNIASGVVLNGEVQLDGSCFIGAGAVIKEKVKICKNVLIGAQSFVNRDIGVPGVYVGSPARRIK